MPIARRTAGFVKRSEWKSVKQILRGAFATIPAAADGMVIVNPLGGTLHHYSKELRQVLSASGIKSDLVTLFEPSVENTSRFKWLKDYCGALTQSRRLINHNARGKVLVIWPVAGFLDTIIIRVVLGTAILVVHDPVPLVRAVGYDRFSRFLAKLNRDKVQLLTHSEKAQLSLATSLGIIQSEIDILPHPVLTGSDCSVRPPSKIISVMGQYKPDRNLELLEVLARNCPPDWELRIVGRGWPHVEGWSVDSRFVSEDEFDEGIRVSSAILVPYSRFYQSGVAIRALEIGTPVVGPKDSVLSDVFGPDSDWLAEGPPAVWISALERAVAASPATISAVRSQYETATVNSWEKFYGAIRSER